MLKISMVLLGSLFISGCFDSESGGTISTVYNSTTSTACYRLLQYKDMSTGSLLGSCQAYEIHDDNSKTQCSTWANQQQLCSLGMPIGNFDWASYADDWQGISLPIAEISGEQAKCIFEKKQESCFPYVPIQADPAPVSTTAPDFYTGWATGVAESGAASGTQQIGGCEWGFAACAR